MRYLFCSAAAVALAVSTAAAAQTTPARQKPAADTAIEELVVTAQRREESLRDVPATISAVTAEQLDAMGPVTSAGDLLRTVPGVRFNDLQSTNLSEVSIRGSGTQRATGADSGVGLFVNGAYVGSSTLGGRNFRRVDFFDQARVEVLEGPQGALYGRNSEYGVVNIVLAKPLFTESGYVNATYTDDQEKGVLAGVVNHQFGDKVAVRIGAEATGQSGGLFYNPTRDTYYDHTDGWVARGQLRYRDGPLDVTFMVDAQDLDLPTFFNTYVLPPGVNAQVPRGFTQDRSEAGHEVEEGVHQEVQRAMILGDYDLGWAKLTSTTMAVHWISDQMFSAGAIDLQQQAAFAQSNQIGVYVFGRTHTTAKDRTLYQDLHLSGDALEGKLEWLAGVDYLLQHDLNKTDSLTSPCALTLNASQCTGTPTAPICVAITATSPACPARFPAAFGAFATAPLRNESSSVYGLVRYHFGALTLAGELRYSKDDKRASNVSVLAYTSTLSAPSAAYAFHEDRVNYTLNASYKIPGPMQALVYAKIGTGYRAGGINARTSSPFAPNPFQPTYGNEDTTSYEAGFKGNLARNIYLRLTAYASETKDAITLINDGCTVLNACQRAATNFNINGGTVHAKGITASIDGRFQVADGTLNVSVNGGRQEASYVDLPNNGYTGLPLKDSSVAQIPKWTASAVVNYRHALTDRIDGFANVSYQEQMGGVQDTITAATGPVYLKDIDLVNLRTGVEIGRLQVAVFVQNLFDRQFALLQLKGANQPLLNRFSNPRTTGLNAIYRW
jgi:iron complex outermembrane receptor protein